MVRENLNDICSILKLFENIEVNGFQVANYRRFALKDGRLVLYCATRSGHVVRYDICSDTSETVNSLF